MGVYDRQIANAKKKIKEKGQSVIWRQITNGLPSDPEKDWKPGKAINVDHPVEIAFFDSDYDNRKNKQYRAGTETSEGYSLGLMAAVDFKPNLKDVVIRNGVEMKLRDFSDLAPNGDSIIYTLEFKA